MLSFNEPSTFLGNSECIFDLSYNLNVRTCPIPLNICVLYSMMCIKLWIPRLPIRFSAGVLNASASMYSMATAWIHKWSITLLPVYQFLVNVRFGKNASVMFTTVSKLWHLRIDWKTINRIYVIYIKSFKENFFFVIITSTVGPISKKRQYTKQYIFSTDAHFEAGDVSIVSASAIWIAAHK